MTISWPWKSLRGVTYPPRLPIDEQAILASGRLTPEESHAIDRMYGVHTDHQRALENQRQRRRRAARSAFNL